MWVLRNLVPVGYLIPGSLPDNVKVPYITVIGPFQRGQFPHSCRVRLSSLTIRLHSVSSNSSSICPIFFLFRMDGSRYFKYLCLYRLMVLGLLATILLLRGSNGVGVKSAYLFAFTCHHNLSHMVRIDLITDFTFTSKLSPKRSQMLRSGFSFPEFKNSIIPI